MESDGGLSEVLSCPCCPMDPACCPRGGVSVRGLWPPSGAGSASRVNGSLTSLRPSLPSFSEGSLRGNYRNKCRLLRTLLFPQVPARLGPPSHPRSASPGLRPARSLVQRGEGSLGGPSSAPHPPTPNPALLPTSQGWGSVYNGPQGGGPQEVTSLGPPPPPCSL